jgi:hypothetical protein
MKTPDMRKCTADRTFGFMLNGSRNTLFEVRVSKPRRVNLHPSGNHVPPYRTHAHIALSSAQ